MKLRFWLPPACLLACLLGVWGARLPHNPATPRSLSLFLSAGLGAEGFPSLSLSLSASLHSAVPFKAQFLGPILGCKRRQPVPSREAAGPNSQTSGAGNQNKSAKGWWSQARMVSLQKPATEDGQATARHILMPRHCRLLHRVSYVGSWHLAGAPAVQAAQARPRFQNRSLQRNTSALRPERPMQPQKKS